MDRATLFKLAALTEDIIKRLRPVLIEFSSKPIKEILVGDLPFWGTRRGWRVSVHHNLPAINQLITLVHETTHTSSLEKLWRLRRILRRKAHVLPRQRENVWKKLRVSEEKGVQLVEREQAIRFLRYLKQRDPQLFEEVMERILAETKQPTLRQALEKYLPRKSRRDVDAIIHQYYLSELF